jgi:hypothetical protein
MALLEEAAVCGPLEALTVASDHTEGPEARVWPCVDRVTC